jgi:hypothetical protein
VASPHRREKLTLGAGMSKTMEAVGERRWFEVLAMPLKLNGSCRCGKIRFSADSHAPVPFMRCYCSICRKTAGGGGFAINLHADKRTLKVEGETAVFHAELDDGQGGCRISTGERHFCAACASAL